jgi:hypothetical protein
LLERVHAHVDRGKPTRQLTSDRRLAHTREAAQHDQHAFMAPELL